MKPFSQKIRPFTKKMLVAFDEMRSEVRNRRLGPEDYCSLILESVDGALDPYSDNSQKSFDIGFDLAIKSALFSGISSYSTWQFGSNVYKIQDNYNDMTLFFIGTPESIIERINDITDKIKSMR